MAYGATFLNCWPIVFVLADKKRELEVSQSHRSKTYLLTNEKDSNTLFRRAHIYYNGENGRKKILYLFRLQPTIKTKQFYPFLHTSGF